MFYHSHINGCHCSQVGATMGITYDNDVANWDVPGTEWYVPKPVDISCDAVDSYIALLTNYIGQWQKRLRDASSALIKNRSKINNAQFMVNALNQRLGEYQVRKDVCMNPPPPPPVVVDESGGDIVIDETGGDGSGESGSTPWLIIGGAVVGAALLLRRRRKTKNRRSSK